MATARFWILDALLLSGRVADAQARLAAIADVDKEIATWSRGGVIYQLAKARIALAQGDAPRAHELAETVLVGVRARKRPTDAQLRGTMMWVARTARAHNDLARATAMATAALERARAEAIDPESSASIGEALLLLAQIEQAAGRSPTALARAAVPHFERNLGANHPWTQAARALADGA